MPPCRLRSRARRAPPRAFQTGAPEALLIDFESGATLFEKNADTPFPAAALSKLMTAELVFHELKAGRLHLDDMFTVSEHAWRTGGAHAHATAMFLDVHSQVRIEDLLRGLIIQSGNDAAITLAEGMSGSEEAFADLMNKRAAELGLQALDFRRSLGPRRPAPARLRRATWRRSPPISSANIPTIITISARRTSPGTRSTR